MASSSSMFAKLLLFTILITKPVISKANEELISQQCHNSQDPTLCTNCLNSDPNSQAADKIGLARIILKCMNSHLLILTNKTSSLALKHHKNPEAASAFTKCGSGYAEAKRGLGAADAHLAVGDYDKAASDVSTKVVSPPAECRDRLMTLKSFDLSSSFRYHTEVYLALTQVVLRIIDRF